MVLSSNSPASASQLLRFQIWTTNHRLFCFLFLLCVCGYLWALQCRCPWSPEEGTGSPGAGVQAVVNSLMCVLGTELTLSSKVLHTFLYLHFYVYGSITVYFDHTPFSFPFFPQPFLLSLLTLLQTHNLFIFTDCYCIHLSMNIICIPKYNMFSTYNATKMCVFRDDHLVVHILSCWTISSSPSPTLKAILWY